MTPAPLAFRLGKVTNSARTFTDYLAGLGPDHAATRCAGFAFDANVSAALRHGATLTEVAYAAGIYDPLAEVRAELDTPIDLTAVA